MNHLQSLGPSGIHSAKSEGMIADRTTAKAFTVFELLTIIVVIMLAAAFLLPTECSCPKGHPLMSAVIKKATRLVMR
jgi:hypothetical protein